MPRANRAVPCGFRRPFQGDGRHDNPHVYGCLYLAESAVSSIVEQLAPFRGNAFESLWANITLFDRAAGRTRLAEVRRLAVSDPSVREATEFLGIAPAS